MQRMKDITKVEIMYYLKNPNLSNVLWQQAKEVREKMIHLDEALEEIKNEIIETTQISAKISSVPGSITNSRKDLFDYIENAENQARDYYKELTMRYGMIMEQMAEIKRVWIVYDTLLPLEREIIKRLYIDNEKWETVEKELGINHRILVKKVSDVWEIIRDKYLSSESDMELARQKNTWSLLDNRKSRKIKKNGLDGQMELEDFISGKEK